VLWHGERAAQSIRYVRAKTARPLKERLADRMALQSFHQILPLSIYVTGILARVPDCRAVGLADRNRSACGILLRRVQIS
jgi:hypothetical protein